MYVLSKLEIGHKERVIALKSKDFFVLLGLEQIPSNEVVILPSLLNYGCKKIS